MQRHFSNRGEALAESAAAKNKTIPIARPEDRSTKRKLPGPWRQPTIAVKEPVSAEKERTIARTGPGTGSVRTCTFQVQGRTLAELMEKAAHALVALDGRPSHSEWFIRRTVEVDGSDRETLLANWLNEVLVREQALHELYDQFVIKEIHGNHMRGELYGRKSKKHITPIKRVELRNLTEHPVDVLQATIVADVRPMG